MLNIYCCANVRNRKTRNNQSIHRMHDMFTAWYLPTVRSAAWNLKEFKNLVKSLNNL